MQGAGSPVTVPRVCRPTGALLPAGTAPQRRQIPLTSRRLEHSAMHQQQLLGCVVRQRAPAVEGYRTSQSTGFGIGATQSCPQQNIRLASNLQVGHGPPRKICKQVPQLCRVPGVRSGAACECACLGCVSTTQASQQACTPHQPPQDRLVSCRQSCPPADHQRHAMNHAAHPPSVSPRGTRRRYRPLVTRHCHVMP